MDAGKHIANANFYDTYYTHSFDYAGNFKYAQYLLSKLTGVPFKKDHKLLDVGCGVGVLGKVIKDRFNSDVYGMDISDVAVSKARENGVKAKVAYIENPWPFKQQSFDIVVSQQVIEHLVNPDYFLQQARKMLKDRGYLVLTTPNLGAWYNRLLLLLGYQPFFTEVSTIDKTVGLSFTRKLTAQRNPLGHLRVFTLRALVDLLNLHGFKVEQTIGGKIFYLPKSMQPIDGLFSNFPSLSSDIIVIGRKATK